MRKFQPLILLTLVTVLYGCHGGASSASSNDAVNVSEIIDPSQEIVEQFFAEFQQNNEDWTKTTEGHEKLTKAFEEKMTSDIDFAKAIASYSTEFEYDKNIRKDDSISPYSKDNGEEGEIKAFEFVIPVKLIKPLYNGQKEIEVSYEIISTIPSTVEEHWRPYTKNVNYCATFSPYFNTNRDGVLNLGSFILTKKD